MMATSQVYRMLGNETLWQTTEQCNRILSEANIPYSICGGVAVCLHGYQRNTVDIDVVIRRNDRESTRNALTAAGFVWDPQNAEFQTEQGITIQFLISGEPAGKGSEVTIPEPIGDLNVEIREGLSVVRLSRLIEMKLACGMGNLRRTHKGFADVVELIAIRKLDGSFARYLHSSVRDAFRKLVLNANTH